MALRGPNGNTVLQLCSTWARNRAEPHGTPAEPPPKPTRNPRGTPAEPPRNPHGTPVENSHGSPHALPPIPPGVPVEPCGPHRQNSPWMPKANL